MGKRRSGRELAFRLLFQIDVGGGTPADVFEVAREASDASSEVWVFAVQLARGAWDKRGEIDPVIERLASGWTLSRMANADRNLLRLALYEIEFRPEIPPSVSINEAVELAKEYSTAESARFLNGILGAVMREQPKDRPDAPDTAVEPPTSPAVEPPTSTAVEPPISPAVEPPTSPE